MAKLEGDEKRTRGCKYLTIPCALAKILPATTVRIEFCQIESASPTTNTFLTFSTKIFFVVVCKHPGNARMPPRVLVSRAKKKEMVFYQIR